MLPDASDRLGLEQCDSTKNICSSIRKLEAVSVAASVLLTVLFSQDPETTLAG
jgi:hypothetical protein